MLNEEHRHAFGAIVADVVGGVQSTHFVDGPGGSGETFLYNVLISEIRGKGLSAAAVAPSGIAALLLTGGRTAHSEFKLPIRVADESVCAVQKGSVAEEFSNGLSLIISDAAPMAHRHLAECVDRSLRDIRSDDRPFGGVVVVFGGDFRQIPPVVRHGGRAQVVSASLRRSPLWRRMQTHALSRNMRLSEGEEEFARYLIRLGDGLEAVVEGEDKIELPAEICADATKMADATDEIGRMVFPDIADRHTDGGYLMEGAVLAAKNEDVDAINCSVIRRPPGDIYDLKSADSVAKDGEENTYPVEFLNSLDISGLPPHVLRLKIGIPVMILRNLNSDRGMCNGSRGIVRRIHPKCVEIELFGGRNEGSREFIPRIPPHTTDSNLPFILARYQFPLRPCFAMSINKCQGHTLLRVGIYLAQSVFSHGQLYVAMSRSGKKWVCVRDSSIHMRSASNKECGVQRTSF